MSIIKSILVVKLSGFSKGVLKANIILAPKMKNIIQ